MSPTPRHGVPPVAYLLIVPVVALGSSVNLRFVNGPGLAQLAPAALSVIGRGRVLSLPAAWSGLLVGFVALAVLTQEQPNVLGTVDGTTAVSAYGTIALLLNLAAAVVVELVVRAVGADADRELDDEVAPVEARTVQGAAR